MSSNQLMSLHICRTFSWFLSKNIIIPAYYLYLGKYNIVLKIIYILYEIYYDSVGYVYLSEICIYILHQIMGLKKYAKKRIHIYI